jgi:ferrous iron transport protein A
MLTDVCVDQPDHAGIKYHQQVKIVTVIDIGRMHWKEVSYMQALSTVDAGSYTVKWMFGVPEVLAYMRSMEIEEGNTIQVISRSMDGLLVRSGSHRVAIGNEVAARIQV